MRSWTNQEFMEYYMDFFHCSGSGFKQHVFSCSTLYRDLGDDMLPATRY